MLCKEDHLPGRRFILERLSKVREAKHVLLNELPFDLILARTLCYGRIASVKDVDGRLDEDKDDAHEGRTVPNQIPCDA